jgi:hypothetical protein
MHQETIRCSGGKRPAAQYILASARPVGGLPSDTWRA